MLIVMVTWIVHPTRGTLTPPVHRYSFLVMVRVGFAAWLIEGSAGQVETPPFTEARSASGAIPEVRYSDREISPDALQWCKWTARTTFSVIFNQFCISNPFSPHQTHRSRQKAQRGATQGIHWTPTPAQVTAAMDWLKQRAEEQMLKWDLTPSRAVHGGVLQDHLG